ncbi:protein of unknown function [Devosia crocina]|uniref:DUF4214 domain-containing protein n=1 Tax=Devosia crocina TaxID=429728 RepID=A0A1I7NDF8_9HYPH|nr:DUF4214 domain-containing protein [Devosia crocina]SFV32586.1 protein of unknown function [Devosia crocina]
MLTATYNVPASDWTRAIDAALLEWSEHLVGSANFNIELAFDTETGFLAYAGPRQWVDADILDGKTVWLPSATADRVTGTDVAPGRVDLRITVNLDWPWFFGETEATPSSHYSATSVMVHELAHGLFMIGSESTVTPFRLWADAHPHHHDDDHTNHLADRSSVMFWQGKRGPSWELSDLDIIAAGGSGLATHGDDLIYLPHLPGATVDDGQGDDTAIWLGRFNDFDTVLVNIERLELRGSDPLTTQQQELYRIYDAAFGRVPDLDGLKYWAASGEGIESMSEHFVGSDEFAALYPTRDRGDFLTALYANVHDRAPDEEGFAYWMGRVDLDDAGLLKSFALSDENRSADYIFLA